MTAEAVRTLRRRLGLTQQELADALGVRSSTVSRWEQGARAVSPMVATALGLLAARHARPPAPSAPKGPRPMMTDDELEALIRGVQPGPPAPPPEPRLVCDVRGHLDGPGREITRTLTRFYCRRCGASHDVDTLTD